MVHLDLTPLANSIFTSCLGCVLKFPHETIIEVSLTKCVGWLMFLWLVLWVKWWLLNCHSPGPGLFLLPDIPDKYPAPAPSIRSKHVIKILVTLNWIGHLLKWLFNLLQRMPFSHLWSEEYIFRMWGKFLKQSLCLSRISPDSAVHGTSSVRWGRLHAATA